MNETAYKLAYHFGGTPPKKPTESLKTICEILNAIPVTEIHNRPELVMNDGLRLSVQGRDHSYISMGCSCSPKSTVGPWTHLEVGFPDRWVARLLPFIEGGETNPVNPPEESVYHMVPIHVLDAIIAEAEGVAGYFYEGELHKVGTICDGLMWLLGSYGYPKPPFNPYKASPCLLHQDGTWEVEGHVFHTKHEALHAMQKYLISDDAQKLLYTDGTWK